MPAAIGQNSSAERDWKHGCITTTTTDPHCLRQSAALHAIDQRPRSVHLVLSLACTTTVFPVVAPSLCNSADEALSTGDPEGLGTRRGSAAR
jgi:hypothetical protein